LLCRLEQDIVSTVAVVQKQIVGYLVLACSCIPQYRVISAVDPPYLSFH